MIKNKINLGEKILLAGANGMAGSAIKRALIKNKYGKKLNGGKIFSPSRQEVDFSNNLQTENWFRENNPSVVIIAAAKVGGILANTKYPADFILDNLKIQTNLIEESWKRGVKRLLFLGSSCIYPKNATQPIKEEDLLNGKLENTNEMYAVAKIAGIKLCHALRIQYNFDAISLMPTNLYGTGDNYDYFNSHVFASLIRKFCEAKFYKHRFVTCLGSGKPLREFLHCDDLGEACICALEKWDPGNKEKEGNLVQYNSHINIGTGKDISIKELAEKIAKATSFEGEIKWDSNKPDGTKRKRLNIEKIKSLGWNPKINLDDGIQKTIDEFKLNYLDKKNN